MQNDDDNGGRKPYKRYKAGRARRSSVDDELAGARPPREPRDEGLPSDVRPVSAERSAGEYRRYGPAPAQGKEGNEATAGGPGTAPGHRRFRWWFIPVGLVVAFIIAGVVVTVLAWPGYQKFARAVDKANKRIDQKTRAELTPDDGWIWRNGTTLLLFGVDSKAGEPARSDTIMLMRFNPKTHTINQLSIPRDTRVQLPNGTFDKINTAMFWGGPSMAVQAVKQFLGVDVNHVMVVDFKGFPRLVNAVGGVDLKVPKTITTIAGANGRTVVFKQGMHHFDGKYAMLYVRIRYADDDFHRAARQQQFVQALQKKIAQPSNITKLPEIGKKFMGGVATDLTTNQIIELGYLKWRATGGKKMVMVGTPGYEGGVAYVFPPSDAEKQKLVHQFLTK
ncbi:MAG: LCP family protein [Actinobacteria bacterium]|nr:LCP family protein [Actinomycetota bacterium]